MEQMINDEVIMDYLSPRKNVPVLRNKSELKTFLVALILFCEKSENLGSEEEASSCIRSKKFIDNILKTARGLQTHNTKIPDANRPLPGPFYKNTKFRDERFVYSGTTNLKRKLFWSGNAAELGKKHFLTAQFIYHGKLTSISEEFALHDMETSDVILILDELGLSKENKDLLKKAINEALNYNTNYAIDPQVLWPLENGEYMCISPVVSCGMQREILERKDPYKDGMFREFETIGIAGSNPGNAGDLSASIMGKFKLLKAGIPRKKSNENELLWKTMFKKGTGFQINAYDDVIFSDYLKYREEGKFHFTHQNKINMAEHLEIFIERSFEFIFEIHYLVNYKNKKIPDWVAKRIHKDEFLFYSDTNKVTIDNFVNHCIHLLKQMALHKEDFMSRGVSDFVFELLSRFLKGALL